jgi:hypothetical protein
MIQNIAHMLSCHLKMSVAAENKNFPTRDCSNARSEFRNTIERFKVWKTSENCQKAGSTRQWLSTPLPLLETYSRPILGTKYNTSIQHFQW